jgi:hypothetical protein
MQWNKDHKSVKSNGHRELWLMVSKQPYGSGIPRNPSQKNSNPTEAAMERFI